MKTISINEFKERRIRLMEQMEVGSIAIIPSAVEVIRNNDVHFGFRQNSDFQYLTALMNLMRWLF